MTKFDPTVDGFTQGSLAQFATCSMKAKLRVVDRLSPKVTGDMKALQYGSFFHNVLDMVYTKHAEEGIPNLDDYVEYAIQEVYTSEKLHLIDTVADPVMYDNLEALKGSVRALVSCYFEYWGEDFSSYEWQSLEEVFEVPYTARDGRVIPIRGKFDGVRRDKTGHLRLFETKTKSRIAEESIQMSVMYNTQVMLYLWAVRHVYGESPTGVDYNLVKRPELRQKKSESFTEFMHRIRQDIIADQSKYFIRYPISITEDEVDEWVENDMVSLVENALAVCDGKIPTCRNSSVCYQYYRPCEYMSVCAEGRFDQFRERDVTYPELLEDTEEED